MTSTNPGQGVTTPHGNPMCNAANFVVTGSCSSPVVNALAVAGHLQEQTGMIIEKIVQALRPLQQVTVVIAGHSPVAADPLTR